MRYNREMSARIFAYIGIVITLYYVIYAIFNGIIHPIPALGDSWDYHIPIAKMILTGEIFSPVHPLITQWYYPGSSELFNSLFLLLHIPLTLTNVLAVIVLFFICWKLGGITGLNYYESIFFASTIITLNVLVRWFNSVNIDIWLVNFFLISIVLLERPRQSLKYFLFLGFILGMIIGTKYTGFYYLLLLFICYRRRFLRDFKIKKLIAFLVPFTIFGLSWYIRNIILFHNPFYPLYFIGLPYDINFDKQVWNIFLSYPKDIIDAAFGEYKIWLISIPFVIVRLLKGFKTPIKKYLLSLENHRLELICILTFIIFLISPTDTKSWIMVSSMRYSYASFILGILIVFLYCKKIKKLEWLFLIAVSSMIMVTSFDYYPKLTIMYGVISLMCCYFLERYKKKLQKLFS